jgi:nucleoside-diphosphate-sugar epimerase
MSILITGAFGFLGSNLCLEFLENGNMVVAFDVVYRIPKFLKRYENNPNLIYVKGDILDSWKIIETIQKYKVNRIIHVATLMEDKTSLQRPYQFVNTNIIGGINILEAARHLNVKRAIVISSRAAYGSYPPSEGPLKEDTQLKPIGFYGASKAALDIILPLYRTNYNLDAISIRTTGIFGPGQGEQGMGHTGMTAPIFYILAKVLNGEHFSMPSGGDHYLEFCYVKDLAKWIRLISEKDNLNHAIYNLSYGRMFSIREIGQMIKHFIPEAKINIGPGQLTGVELRAALDISLAEADIGYNPLSIEESIKNFIKYLKS